MSEAITMCSCAMRMQCKKKVSLSYTNKEENPRAGIGYNTIYTIAFVDEKTTNRNKKVHTHAKL